MASSLATEKAADDGTDQHDPRFPGQAITPCTTKMTMAVQLTAAPSRFFTALAVRTAQALVMLNTAINMTPMPAPK